MMKKIVFILFIFLFFCGYAQKKKTIEYFNINKYKDWETKDDSSSNDKTFLKGDQYIRIMKYDSVLLEDISSLTNPIEIRKAYSLNTQRKIYIQKKFYGFPIEITKSYNENGKLIKETNNDKDFPFNVKDLCSLIKKEYGIDLMHIEYDSDDIQLKYTVNREQDNVTKKYMYSVKFSYADIAYTKVYVDGKTGKVFYEDSNSNGVLATQFKEKIPKSKTKFPQKQE